MKQKSIQRSLLLFAILFMISVNTFSQNNEKDNSKSLIVIDIQNAFTQRHLSESSTQKFMQNVNSVIERFDANKIIYFQGNHLALYITKKGPKLGLDTIGFQLDKRLNLVNDNIVFKKDLNAFSEIELIQFLEKNNTKNVVVIGMMAGMGIKETLIGGKELGYNMFFIPEAITEKSEKKKEKILIKLIKKGIKEIPLNDIIKNTI